jgi:hypothetical protein
MAVNRDILDQAEKEVTEFDRWFVSQGAEPLARFERAILKSFLVAKATGKLSPTTNPQPSGPCQLN